VKLRHLTLALLLGPASLTSLSAHALDERVAAFDAHANEGIPVHFFLRTPEGGAQQIALLGKLRSDVEVDGRPGTIVRLGNSLDIALDDDEPAPATSTGPIDIEYAPSPLPPSPETWDRTSTARQRRARRSCRYGSSCTTTPVRQTTPRSSTAM
jgi:hypothetical protein